MDMYSIIYTLKCGPGKVKVYYLSQSWFPIKICINSCITCTCNYLHWYTCALFRRCGCTVDPLKHACTCMSFDIVYSYMRA